MDVRRYAGVALTFFVVAAAGFAQSTRPEDIAQGGILIMQRDAPDPLFAHSVILLAKHEQAGTVGLMIHYRSNIPIVRALKGIAGADKRTDSMFVGGPVELEGVMGLVRADAPPPGGNLVKGKLYLVASKDGVAAALAEKQKPSDVRLFLGYTGWGPAQLAREVRQGGWWIFPYDESLVFDEHPETLWSRLIKRAETLKVSLQPFSQRASIR
jgi:putative transcriptional regulator